VCLRAPPPFSFFKCHLVRVHDLPALLACACDCEPARAKRLGPAHVCVCHERNGGGAHNPLFNGALRRHRRPGGRHRPAAAPTRCTAPPGRQLPRMRLVEPGVVPMAVDLVFSGCGVSQTPARRARGRAAARPAVPPPPPPALAQCRHLGHAILAAMRSLFV